MARNYSIDIETFGTGAFSVITTIGVCRFRPTTGEILERLEIHVDVASAVGHGLRMDPGTVIWWLQQSKEAQQALTAPYQKHLAVKPRLYSLKEAANALYAFMAPDGEIRNNIVWGNGPGFDCNKINEMLSLVQGSKPCWEFWNERCVRTVKDLADIQKGDIERDGVHHSAIDDAEFQAKIVSQAFMRLHDA